MEIHARNAERIASSVILDQTNAKSVQRTQNSKQMEHAYANKASSSIINLNLVSVATNHAKLAKALTSAVLAQLVNHLERLFV